MNDGLSFDEPLRMTDTVKIRRVRPEDASAVAALFSQLGYPSGVEEMRVRIGAILELPSHWCGVADWGTGVVGCGHVFSVPILEAGWVAQVGGLVVDETWQRRGVGRELMGAAEAWAAAQGCVSVYVRTNIVRSAAHAFYEGIGYGRAKTQYAYRKRLDAAGRDLSVIDP